MPKQKIVVSERDNIAALFEEERAVEFIIHRGDMLLGDVYLATVENILPSIDAAFVNVGADKMGFLHSSDVKGKGDLHERIKPKQKIVVQVMKEPTGHKGPRVTTNISLPGRFLVLMPESRGVSISRKVESSKERARLKSIVSMIKPSGVGVIIRTEAENQKESDIQEDFETLLERWQNIVAAADTANPPALLYRDQDLLYRVIREVVTEDTNEIVVDTAFGQQRAQQLLQNWNLDKGIKVNLHEGNNSIMIAHNVDREIKLALNTKVPLPSGGYLYIQPTEALCVIDVNSGKFTSLKSQAETIRLTNLEACKEIARQLRLRNIGGMIIVDFIDMENRPDQLSILQAFELELEPDKSKPQMGQLTDLGLVEMTRHRQGQALSEIFTKNCHACHGSGHVHDDFNWAPTNIDGDVRGGRHGKGNLPIKSSRHGGRDRQVPRLPRGATDARTKVADLVGRGDRDKRREFRPGEALLNKREQENQQEARGGNGRTYSQPLDELLKQRLLETTGLRFAEGIRVAVSPAGANSILARINPKANDVIALIRSIEETGGILPSMDDYDFNEADGGDEEDSSENDEDEAVAEDRTDRSRNARNDRGDRGDRNDRNDRDRGSKRVGRRPGEGNRNDRPAFATRANSNDDAFALPDAEPDDDAFELMDDDGDESELVVVGAGVADVDVDFEDDAELEEGEPSESAPDQAAQQKPRPKNNQRRRGRPPRRRR